ncbi:MAG: FCD domain-containing protein, partial [Pseudomonadota bacterium]
MLHMMRSMMDLLREGVFYNRSVMFNQKSTRDVLLDQHRQINDALQARDADGAKAAVERHLTFVRRCLTDQREADRHESTARLRLEREAAR